MILIRKCVQGWKSVQVSTSSYLVLWFWNYQCVGRFGGELAIRICCMWTWVQLHMYNSPFVWSGHMVQNKVCLGNYTVGLPKQRNLYQSSLRVSFVLKVPLCNLHSSTIYSIPYLTRSCKGPIIYYKHAGTKLAPFFTFDLQCDYNFIYLLFNCKLRIIHFVAFWLVHWIWVAMCGKSEI